MNFDGLDELDSIFEETFGDGQGEPVDGQAGSEEDVESGDVEQSSDVEDVPTKLADLVQDSEEQADDDSASAVDLEQIRVEVDGEELSLQDLKDGYLRRKDYTQKTQELAELRKEAQNALELYELLKKDPKGTIASLAAEMGLIDPMQVDVSEQESKLDLLGLSGKKGFDKDEIEKIVAERVEQELAKRLEDDPALKRVQVQEAQERVNRIFDGLEKTYSVELDDADRNAILKMALKLGTENLEYVFLKMRAQLDQVRSQRQSVKDAAPKKGAPGGDDAVDDDFLSKPPKDIFEAFKQAEIELATR